MFAFPPSTPLLRRSAKWLLIVVIVLPLGGCPSLPAVPDTPERDTGATPTVNISKGTLSADRAGALLARRWSHATHDLRALAVQEEAVTGVPLIAGNQVTLLFDGPQTMQAMMEAAAAARETINLETYIFDQDEVGMKFANLLIARQQAGVNVNIMYDSVGTLGVPQAFFDRMRAAGIHLLAFNPVNPAKAHGNWRLNNRDHRKLMVVDGRVAFTGGINISSDYANSSLFRSRKAPESRRDVGWRDTHIRIEGPAVAALQYSFIANWIAQQGGDLQEANYFPWPSRAGDKIVRVLATAPGRGFEIYKAFMVAIQEARKSVHITSAYFVPDQHIIGALCDAARRGADVRLILPGVSDHGLVFHAGRAFYDQLLSSGVRIFELQVAVLHAKTAVIDAGWSTVGSANIDRRSFQHNYELNVMVLDPAFGQDMEAAFQEDLRNSREVTLEQWRRRPLKDRVLELSARLFDYWL